MSKPQIQYSPIAEPPAFTPPTVAQMGWQPSYPRGRDVRRLALTGAIIAGAYFADTKTPSAAVAPPLAVVETPAVPAQFIKRSLHAARTPWFVGDVLGNMAVAVPVGFGFEASDDPRMGRRAALSVACLQNETDFGVEVDVPVESWTAILAEVRRVLSRSGGTAPQLCGDTLRSLTTATIVGWGVTVPDDPRLGRKARLTEFPAQASTTASEPWSVPPVSWQPVYPDRLVRPRTVPEHPAPTPVFAVEQWSIPSNAWQPTYPDRLTRAKSVPERPAYTAVHALEQFSIPPESWQPRAIDRAVRAKGLIEHPACIWPTTTVAVSPAPASGWEPQAPARFIPAARVREYPAVAVPLGLTAAVTTWWPLVPDRTSGPVRRLLTTAPAIVALEQLPTVTSWLPWSPDRPVRARRIVENLTALGTFLPSVVSDSDLTGTLTIWDAASAGTLTIGDTQLANVTVSDTEATP